MIKLKDILNYIAEGLFDEIESVMRLLNRGYYYAKHWRGMLEPQIIDFFYKDL